MTNPWYDMRGDPGRCGAIRALGSSTCRIAWGANSLGRLIPKFGWLIPLFGWLIPLFGWLIPLFGWLIPFFGWLIPLSGWLIPLSGWLIPLFGFLVSTIIFGINHCVFGINHPFFGINQLAAGINHPFFGINHPFFGINHPFFGINHSVFGINQLVPGTANRPSTQPFSIVKYNTSSLHSFFGTRGQSATAPKITKWSAPRASCVICTLYSEMHVLPPRGREPNISNLWGALACPWVARVTFPAARGHETGQEALEKRPTGPKRRPRQPESAPRHQYGPNTAQESPMTAQEGSKMTPRGPHEGDIRHSH